MQAFMRARNVELPVEVEASSIGQVQEVLDLLASEPQCMVSRIMLDNMARLDPSAPGAPICNTALFGMSVINHARRRRYVQRRSPLLYVCE